jgi:type II secretory pathway component PulC
MKEVLYKLNLLLSIICLLLLFYLLREIITPLPQDIPIVDIKKEGSRRVNLFTFSERKPFSTYEAIFSSRKLFFSSLVETTTEKKPEVSSSLKFSLIGVVSSRGKYQALIRNTANNRDYYCFQGDVIEGMEVKEIYQDRVVLEAEGKVWELRL